MALEKPFYTTKVITAVNGDKWQYFHHHKNLDDVRVNVNGDQCLEIAISIDSEYVTYPLCNVERFETKRNV